MEKTALKIIGTYPTGRGIDQTRFELPITPRENFRRFVAKGEKPVWMPCTMDFVTLHPRIIPDNIARAMVMDGKPFNSLTDAGGPDIFGINWRFVPTAQGSMVVPGAPALLDANDWEKVVKFPDLDALDWEGAAEQMRPLYETDRVNQTTIFTGLFERLISFMDFENAAMALIDEDQQEAVHALFSKLCDLYDGMMMRFKKYFNIDMVTFHDDWGSQRAPFFSPSVCEEMLVPYLKRVVDSAHKYGIILNFHCCGKDEPLVPMMIKAGVDIWSGQNLNDWEALSELYDGQIIFSVSGGLYNSKTTTEDEFLETVREMWDKYEKYSCCLLSPAKMYYPGLSDRCYQLMYDLSTEYYAK